jgi:TatA/E family protein of Tat protein translocase
MDSVGPWELLIMLLAIGLLFGTTRLSKLACSLGGGIWEFRSAVHDGTQASNPDAAQEPGADSPPAAR